MIGRFDAAVLRRVDGAIAWLWSTWGVARRTILAMLLIGWVATELASEMATYGHVSLLDAGLLAALLAIRGVADYRTPAGIVAARRDLPLARLARLICWPFAVWDAVQALFLAGAFIGVAAAVLFIVYIYASDSLTPKGPPGPKRRETTVMVGSAAMFGR